MATGTADDADLSDLLLGRLWGPDDPRLEVAAAELAIRDPAVDSSGAVTRALLGVLDQAWERGWQPADVAHTVTRETSQRLAPLVVALIGEHARRTAATSRAPAGWVAQLHELGALAPGDPAVVAAWHRDQRRPPQEAWRWVLRLATSLRLLARLDVLMPPPSRWDSHGGRPTAGTAPDGAPAGGRDEARALRRIRALLNKAESTEFPDEAEVLTAKAQELMTRHAVDAALLEAGEARTGRVQVDTRRLHVADPYSRAKMQLLAAVAEANGVRLVWYQGLGIANLVGVRADLDAVELLFTSLLLQVAQALATAERPAARQPAVRSFRRSFLLGYAQRIGERLRAARERATAAAAADHGAQLLPVLRGRQEAVEATVSELFPRVRASRSRASLDAGGWYAGRAAADRADVGRRPQALD